MAEKLNTLLVEDTPGDASIIEFYLAEQFSESYNFFHVDKFKDCLQELKIKKYDVVLLDLDLPDSQGINTLTTLMQAHPEQLVIVLTGLNDDKTGLITVQKGANDYMVKGKFDAEMLNSKIKFAHERYLAKLKNNRSNFEQETVKNILALMKAGYIEVEKNHQLITKIQLDQLSHIFETPIKSLGHFTSYYKDKELIIKQILDLCNEDSFFKLEVETLGGHQLLIQGNYTQLSNTMSFLIIEKQA